MSPVSTFIIAFLSHMKSVYQSLQCAHNELFKICGAADVVSAILDFCKLKSFDIHIDDEDAHGDEELLKSSMAKLRSIFAQQLTLFIADIGFDDTAKTSG